jgi:hypothetical protein
VRNAVQRLWRSAAWLFGGRLQRRVGRLAATLDNHLFFKVIPALLICEAASCDDDENDGYCESRLTEKAPSSIVSSYVVCLTHNTKDQVCHRYLRVIMLTKELSRLDTNAPIAESRSFCATGDNANMLNHLRFLC